mmetsp:Transcript_1322/g.5343  ORF Transcript_1322/g.5343 Transcript_1322/m.5343 type:complete len:344 (+) Transcript_1322:339-1370(+)
MGAPDGPHGGLCLVGEAGQPTRALLADLQLWRPWRREGASIHKARAANATHACSAQQRGQRIKQRRRRHPAAAFAGAWQAARHRSHGARAQRRRPPAACGVLGAPSAREVEQHPLARGDRALAAKQLGALDLQRLLPSVQRRLFFGQLMCALQPRLRLRVGPLLRSWGRRQGRGHRGGHHRAGLPHCIRESYPPAAGVGSRILGQLLRLLRLLPLRVLRLRLHRRLLRARCCLCAPGMPSLGIQHVRPCPAQLLGCQSLHPLAQRPLLRLQQTRDSLQVGLPRAEPRLPLPVRGGDAGLAGILLALPQGEGLPLRGELLLRLLLRHEAVLEEAQEIVAASVLL